MAVASAPRPGDRAERPLGAIVTEVSEKASLLVREEIELAKAEVAEKIASLLRGSAVAAAAGVFVLAALLLAMHGLAWLLNDAVFDNPWAGFFVEAAALLAVAAGAGYYAYRSLRRGAPPTPAMAIEEARKTRETFEGARAAEAGGRR